MAASSAGVGALSLGASGAYTWKVASLSTQTEAQLCSPSFTVGGIEWQMDLHPKGDQTGAGSHLSLYLRMVDGANKPWGWNCPVSVKLAVKSQTEACHTVTREYYHGFHRLTISVGFSEVRNHPCSSL